MDDKKSESEIDDEKDLLQNSGEEPKESAPGNTEKSKLDNTNSTLANKESLDEIQEASPDLTIAFLILLGLGISIFYNQSQQD